MSRASDALKRLDIAETVHKNEVKLDGQGKNFSAADLSNMRKDLIDAGYDKSEVESMDDQDLIGTWQAETGYVEPDEKYETKSLPSGLPPPHVSLLTTSGGSWVVLDYHELISALAKHGIVVDPKAIPGTGKVTLEVQSGLED